MPLYEYICKKCGLEFEDWARSVTKPAKPACPDCKSKSAERKLSVFAARQGSAGSSAMPEAGPCGSCCQPGGACPMMDE